jgi:hypothetical protein
MDASLIADRTGIVAESGEGPALLRLKLLELMHSETGRTESIADGRMDALQRTMIERPSATLVDVLAKLQTVRMRSTLASLADRLDLQLIESAIADLERLPALD